MMQPRSPPHAPTETPARMMEPSRRKRKRPAPSDQAHAKCSRQASGSSETEDHDTMGTSDAASDDGKQETAFASKATASATTPRGPFRGKCLYQSRKCENERALKRNGQPHNLCDEHRDKQNQHQRKFDAKKYTRKARTHSGSDGDESVDHEATDLVCVTHATVGKTETTERAEHDTSESKTARPSGKRRAGGPKPKRSKVSPATATVTLSSEALASASASAAAPFPPGVESNIHRLATATTYYCPAIHSTATDVRPLEMRRPPALEIARSSPPSGLSLSHVGRGHSSPGTGTFGHVLGLDRRSPLYTHRDHIAVPPATPVDGSRPFPSPHGATVVYPFMRPPPQTGTRSFDAGVTRISPMGGAAPGSVGQLAFDRPRPFLDGHRVITPEHHTARPLLPTSTGSASSIIRADKLPSLQQLPLGQLARASAQHSPYAQASYPGDHHLSPTLGHSPYARPSPSHQHQHNAFGFPRPTGPLLPSLAPLRGSSHPTMRPTQTSLSPSPPHASAQRSYSQPRDHDQHLY